jgi:hypothetical protein
MQVMMHADCQMFGTSVTRFEVDNLSDNIWGLFKISQTEQAVPIHILDDYVRVRCGKGIGRVVIGESLCQCFKSLWTNLEKVQSTALLRAGMKV